MTATRPAKDPSATDEAWRRWGEQDPYFGVITDAKFRRDRLDQAAIDEFFASGTRHANHVLHQCSKDRGKPFKPARVLDFGCGVGRLAIAFAARGAEVVGVDISPAMLAEARQQAERLGVADRSSFVESDDQLSKVEGHFDLVHSFIVFQHMAPRRGGELMDRLLQRLKPGGHGALHFTYAKAWLEERLGVLPELWWAPEQPVSVPAARPLAARLRAALRPPRPAPEPSPEPAPGTDPDMQMNAYLLNELCFRLQRAGMREVRLEFTDHGGEMGATLFFRSPAA